MFTRTQWYEFFRAYGLDAQDAQASAEQAFADQFDAPEMDGPPLTAQPRNIGPLSWATGADVIRFD